MMMEKDIAYCNFSLLENEISFLIVYKDKSNENFQFNTKNILQRCLSNNLDKELFTFVKNIKEEALSFLNKNSFNDILIALDCHNELRNQLLTAFKENGFFIYDILTKGEAETICFYNDFESQLKPLLEKILYKLKNDKTSILKDTENSLKQIEDAYQALNEKQMTVGIVGAMKAGKSTFLNALLGDFIMPAMDKRCTRRRFVLRNADEYGSGRRIKIWLMDSDSKRILSKELSIDVDALRWNSQQLRSYLFALNSPNLINSKIDTDSVEQKLLDDFKKLPFGSEIKQNKIYQSLMNESSIIDTIDIVHPFPNLSIEDVGKIEFWDTPGPNSISEEARENFKEQRFFSDREIFKKAVEDSSALIIIFDVMQQESEAQEEIFKIISSRKKGNSCTLIVANKVDQRPIREVLPLGQLLQEIQNQAYKRHNMLIRPPIPTSSRPAQLAREIMQYDSIDSAPKDLLDEYEQVERREDKRSNKDHPEKSVEQRSGILETEKLLKRFFKQAPGLAVLTGAIGTTLNFLNNSLNSQKQIFSSYQKEQKDFENAANVINEGYNEMNKRMKEDIIKLGVDYDKNLNSTNKIIGNIITDSTKILENYWNEKFDKKDKITFKEYKDFEGGAFTGLLSNFDKIEEQFQKFYKEDFITPITQYYKRIREQLNEIEKKAAKKLDIEIETKIYIDKYNYQKVDIKKDINPKVEKEEKKDSGHIVDCEDNGIIGGGLLGLIGGGVGAGLLLASGPVGWLIAGAVGGTIAGGIGGATAGGICGNIYGRATANSYTTEFVTKKEVVNSNIENVKNSFKELENKNQKNLNELKNLIIKEIEKEVNKTINNLKARLDEAQKLANDPNRIEKIEKLEQSIKEIQTDIKPISIIAERIGMDYIN